MQPTAQAVGTVPQGNASPEGAKENYAGLKPFGNWTRRTILVRDRRTANPARSIPNVTFVVLNMILFQKRDELFLKRMFLVMLLLSRDVFSDRRDMH